MEQAALFYEDFLKEGNDGKYIFNPSYSPENNPANSSSQACVNATMDVMAANGLLRSVIEASQILGVNQDKIPVWKAMQEKMPSYMLNENGKSESGCGKICRIIINTVMLLIYSDCMIFMIR